MAEYYAVERSSEYLMHYGVKGMKWGVRKARESGNERALSRHYAKAEKKYEKLIKRADIPTAANNAYLHRAISRGAMGVTGVQAGLSGALLAEQGVKGLPLAAFTTGPSAAIAAVSRINYLRNKHKLTTKGHNKAVQKVRNWESEASKAFKGTKYENAVRAGISGYDDSYAIRDLIKDKNGAREKTIARISGSHLTSDYRGKDKRKFMKLAGQPVDDRVLVSRPKLSSSESDPMSFRYSYHSIHRKRKEKKLPWYMSGKDVYDDYHRVHR